MFQIVNKERATATHHWFFLIQPYDYPERLIGAAAEYDIRYRFERAVEAFPPEAVAEYVRCLCNPATTHATCEDDRAGASIDLVHDEADRQQNQKVTYPLLALWSATGSVGCTQEVLQIWRDYAMDVCGHSLPCGRSIPEEMPDAAYAALTEVLLEKDGEKATFIGASRHHEPGSSL